MFGILRERQSYLAPERSISNKLRKRETMIGGFATGKILRLRGNPWSRKSEFHGRLCNMFQFAWPLRWRN
jgi:hypothetical protein